MATTASATRLKQFFRISRILAGQLDFSPAIRAVAAEVATIVPHDHLDVCIVRGDRRFHTAYETGIDTAWGRMPLGPVNDSPIRSLLLGEVDHILTDDAMNDPRFQFGGAFHGPIFDHALRSRLHVPMIVRGEIIGALSCSLTTAGRYGDEDLRNARYIAELLSPYFFALRAAEQARQSEIVEAEARAREEGLRLGALRLTEALEQERQRIGMDLHDQTLADLTRLARQLERLSGDDSITPRDLDPLARSLHQSMQSLRQIIEAAKPSVLHLFGFADAVENHLDRAIRDSGQSITGQIADDSAGAVDGLPPAMGIALFRITQEAINNAVNHGQASAITINLTAPRGAVAVAICDNGRGIPKTRPRGGSGIDNMRTRARLISARFTVGTGPDGTGTRILISLPGRMASSAVRMSEDAP
jgi:signal transduction histidine kinase